MSDVKKTELIAKRVRKHSNANKNELEILQYLHTNRTPSLHVVALIDSVTTATETWVILPKLCTIRDMFVFDGGKSHRGKIDQFCWGLIKGVAYLHENRIVHLDIKPDNLVCDEAYQLKIVDFDIAIQVENEDEEIKGFRGTQGWTAPEVGEEGGMEQRYSAIKADRWACGRVLQYFLKIEGGNRVLSTVAERLTARTPGKRPSLVEWPEWSDAALSKVNGTNRVVRRPRQDRAGSDEDDVKAPLAKRFRVEALEQAVEILQCAPACHQKV